MVDAPPAPSDPHWFVCHTKPRCEKKFAALLEAEQVAHYLALVPSVRRYGRQTKRFTKPLFPGYVFALVPLERKSRLHQQDLLARVIPVENEHLFLRQLEEVKRIIVSGYELTVRPLLAPGRRVRVSGGPLRGLEGFVDDPSNPQGVVLSVDVLQQGLHVRVPVEHLHILP